MPTPIDHINKDATCKFPIGGWSDFSDLAAKIMEVIAIWSQIDAGVTHTFSRFLKADYAVGVTVFDQLQTAQARRKALLAATTAAAPLWQVVALEAILEATKVSLRTRNRFAHHILGVSPEIEGAILTVEPEEITALSIQELRAIFVSQSEWDKYKPRSIDRRKVFVWSRGELVTAINDARQAHFMFTLYQAVVGSPGVEGARRDLWHNPNFQSAAQKVLRRRKASPELREQLAPPGENPPAPGISRVWDEQLGRDMSKWVGDKWEGS